MSNPFDFSLGQLDRNHADPPSAWTGIVCRRCLKAVVVIEKTLPHGFAFHCPGCDYRWTTEGPYVPKP